MKSVAKLVVITLAVYTLVAAFVPHIRLFYWRMTPTKMGGISYFGVSVFLWVAVIELSSFVEIRHPLAWYCLALFGLFISFIGYVIDSV
jgi:uncharacterized transporter YbjL